MQRYHCVCIWGSGLMGSMRVRVSSLLCRMECSISGCCRPGTGAGLQGSLVAGTAVRGLGLLCLLLRTLQEDSQAPAAQVCQAPGQAEQDLLHLLVLPGAESASKSSLQHPGCKVPVKLSTAHLLMPVEASAGGSPLTSQVCSISTEGPMPSELTPPAGM